LTSGKNISITQYEELRLIDLQSRDILKINATIIAGAFIFLTFIGFSFETIDKTEIFKIFPQVLFSLLAIIMFSISSLQCIAGKKSQAMNWMYYGYAFIIILAVAFLGWMYYQGYVVQPQKSSNSTNQSK
jgi:hypothetical protein